VRSDHGTSLRWPPGQVARVLVADDHPVLRMGIRHALDGPAFVVCAEAADADEAVAAAVRERPDVCLLDVSMPGGGISAAERIAALVPGTAVVMVSASTDDTIILSSLRAGAVGFLLKDAVLDRLPQALLGVLNGEAAVSRDMMGRVVDEIRGARTQRPRRLPPGISLTSRETDVLELLLQGLGTAEIASRHYLTSATIRSHVAALLRKFSVKERSALLALFNEAAPLVEEDTPA
jgi:DNA-binding NarL/FixJ family response regulator